MMIITKTMIMIILTMTIVQLLPIGSTDADQRSGLVDLHAVERVVSNL